MDRTVSGVIAMIPRIAEMRHVEDFRIWLRFKDGREGVMDLSDELWGESSNRSKICGTSRRGDWIHATNGEKTEEASQDNQICVS